MVLAPRPAFFPLLRPTLCNFRARRLCTFVSACASRSVSSKGLERYAIIGGGFAGVATAWHLLAAATAQQRRIAVHLYDKAGLGGGASGAAAGLLHPLTPKGKALWQGDVAMQAALDLVSAAQATSSRFEEPFVWRQPVLRLAQSAKQMRQYEKSLAGHRLSSVQARLITAQEADLLTKDPQHLGLTGSAHGGVLIQGGLVLEPKRYLRALWQACMQLAQGHQHELQLTETAVTSLSSLQADSGPWQAIIATGGAAVTALPEIGDLMGLQLCQGYTIALTKQHQSCQGQDSVPTENSPPEPAASMLGAPYLARQGAQLVVGATKVYDFPVGQTLLECGRDIPMQEAASAAQQLIPSDSLGLIVGAACPVLPAESAAHVYCGPSRQPSASPPADGGCLLGPHEHLSAASPEQSSPGESGTELRYELVGARSGVRAMPPRTQEGAMPLAGRLPDHALDHRWWVLTGLGARGLVYHAWLGQLMAQAVLADSERGLPAQLLRWKPIDRAKVDCAH